MNGLQKLNELRKRAKERGIEGYAKMKTAELEAILATAVVTETAERTGEPVETVSERLLPTVEEVAEAERGITNIRNHTPGIVLRDGGRLTPEEVETIFTPEPDIEEYARGGSPNESTDPAQTLDREDTEPFEGEMLPEEGDDEYPAPAPVHPIDRPTGPKRGIVPQRHMTKHKTPKVRSKPSNFRR